MSGSDSPFSCERSFTDSIDSAESVEAQVIEQNHLPNYLVQVSRRHDQVHAADIIEEENEIGDGGDSDDDGDPAIKLFEAYDEAREQRSGRASFLTENDDVEDVARADESNSILFGRNKTNNNNWNFGKLKHPKPPVD